MAAGVWRFCRERWWATIRRWFRLRPLARSAFSRVVRKTASSQRETHVHFFLSPDFFVAPFFSASCFALSTFCHIRDILCPNECRRFIVSQAHISVCVKEFTAHNHRLCFQILPKDCAFFVRHSHHFWYSSKFGFLCRSWVAAQDIGIKFRNSGIPILS